LTEAALRIWAKARLRSLWAFEERADAEINLRSASSLDLDEFDHALTDVEAESGVSLPILNTVANYNSLYKIFTTGVVSKILLNIEHEVSENVDLGTDKFSKQYDQIKSDRRDYENKYLTYLNEYLDLSMGMIKVVQRSGYWSDPLTGEDLTDRDTAAE